jgi:hypothetical protein
MKNFQHLDTSNFPEYYVMSNNNSSPLLTINSCGHACIYKMKTYTAEYVTG